MSKGKDISTMFTREENKKKWKTWIWTGYQREERCYQSGTVWSILAEKR